MVKYYQSKGEFYMKQNTIEHLAKLARNKYHNNWQRQNPEKVKKAQERYWQKKAQKMLEEQNNEN